MNCYRYIMSNQIRLLLDLKGLVFHINPSPKVSEALATGAFSKVVTAMIGGNDTTVFRNVEDLKIKAILEYRDGMLLVKYFK